MVDRYNLEALEGLTIIPNGPINIVQTESFTDNVAARMGRALQQRNLVFQQHNVVVNLTISVGGLTATGPFDDLLTCISNTTTLRRLTLIGNHFASPAVSSAPVVHRILTAVPTSTSIRELVLSNTQVAPASLCKQPNLIHLGLLDCTIAATEVFDMDEVRNDELQSSMEQFSIGTSFGTSLHDEPYTANTLNLLLEVSQAHSKVEKIGFVGGNKQIVGERITDILQAQKHVASISLVNMGSELSWFETFINKLNAVSNSTVKGLEFCWSNFRLEDGETNPQILPLVNSIESEKSKIIDAMYRSSSIVHIAANVTDHQTYQVVQSIFNEQDKEQIRRIGYRNLKLAELTGSVFDTSLTQGLWPYIIELAAQSGHPDHTTLINRIILEKDAGLNSTFSNELGDVMMGKK